MFLRIFFLFISFFASPLMAKEKLVVFAAASQAEVMAKIGVAFEQKCDCQVVFSFAASSILARQIEAGAGADLFISANINWAKWLESRALSQSITPIISNRLVLVSTNHKTLKPEDLNHQRFSMADPRSVPAGIYAKEALMTYGIWEEARANAVFTENVRIALALVLRGDLDGGVVYQSDLSQFKGNKELNAYRFPEKSHSHIQYVSVRLTEKKLSAEFIGFLKSDEAQNIFKDLGFLPLSANKAQ